MRQLGQGPDSADHVPALSSAFTWLFCGAEDLGSFVWSPITQLLTHGCLTWETLVVVLLIGANFFGCVSVDRSRRRSASRTDTVAVAIRRCGNNHFLVVPHPLFAKYFPAESEGISELRWAPASKAGSMHVVNSGKAPGQTGKTLLCVAVGRSGPHAAR